MLFAEEEGFEPPERFRSIVFKTTAIDHSAIPPNCVCPNVNIRYKQTRFVKRSAKIDIFVELANF